MIIDASTKKNLITGEETVMDIPKSNVLIYHTEDGTKVAARPSGTEPKIKFYFSVKSKLDTVENAEKVEAELDAKIQRIIKEMKLLMNYFKKILKCYHIKSMHIECSLVNFLCII